MFFSNVGNVCWAYNFASPPLHPFSCFFPSFGIYSCPWTFALQCMYKQVHLCVHTLSLATIDLKIAPITHFELTLYLKWYISSLNTNTLIFLNGRLRMLVGRWFSHRFSGLLCFLYSSWHLTITLLVTHIDTHTRKVKGDHVCKALNFMWHFLENNRRYKRLTILCLIGFQVSKLTAWVF